MVKLKNDSIVLSAEGSNTLRNVLLRPNAETMEKREHFLSNLSQVKINKKSDGSIELDIPWLDLSDLSGREESLECTLNVSLRTNKYFKELRFVTAKHMSLENTAFFTSSSNIYKNISKQYDVCEKCTQNTSVNNSISSAA